MMIKGDNPENIKVGSTLSIDEFAGKRFDFMLSNPPYGKSWASEVKYIKDGKDVFRVELVDYWGEHSTVDATPRSSDGQLLFLMEMVSKMKSTKDSPLGSRVASVHNGSSLFTGDAGGGESNIRRYIIEKDLLDAIVQMPNNLFYNTGITTYIWLLTNSKPDHRKGKVQLIDANPLFRKLRKNLGNKNCEFAPEHIDEIMQAYQNFQSVEGQLDENGDPEEGTGGLAVQIFNNSDFGYYKVTIDRPDRRRAQFSSDRLAPLRFDKQLSEAMTHIYETHGEAVYADALQTHHKEILQWCEDKSISLNAKARYKLLDVKFWRKMHELHKNSLTLMETVGMQEYDDFNRFKADVDAAIKAAKIKLSAPGKKAILNAVSWYDKTAAKVIKKRLTLKGDKLVDILEHLGCSADDLGDFGYFRQDDGSFLTYEPNSDLRDAESVPLSAEKSDTIHRYFLAEVKPHVTESWINLDSVKIGYEISFNKYFYRHKPLCSLEEVTSDILELEQQAEGLMAEILGLNDGE